MPLTEKGGEILSNMEKEYGKEKGERVFYASRNAGTISGVDAVTGLSAQEKLFGMQRPMAAADAERTAKTKDGRTVVLNKSVKVDGGIESWVIGANGYAVRTFVPEGRSDAIRITKAQYEKKVRDGDWEPMFDITRAGYVEVRLKGGKRETVEITDHRADATFSPGDRIRANRQGAPVEVVTKVVDNMVYTDRNGPNSVHGGYHVTKIVRAEAMDCAADTMAQQLGSMGADVKRLIEKATRSDQKDKEIHTGVKDAERSDENSWLKVSSAQFEQLQIGKTYMLDGRKGKVIEKEENKSTGTNAAGWSTSARMVRVQWK